MTEKPAISQDQPVAVGPGRLVLVVGPSGAGKDTLIGLVQSACADDGVVVFPRRVVTREASAFEDNEQVTPAEFRQLLVRGDFAVHWQAHGHSYALSRAIDDDIRAGRVVVANVSRTVIETLRGAYADVVVVLITAPPEILSQRLAARARSSDGQLADRLGRTVEDASPDVTIVNVGTVDDHARRLLGIIRADRGGW